MLPLTAYAAKIAASTTGGAVTATWAVFAATDPTVTVGGFIVGGGTFAAGVYKLLSDHTAQTALRETLEQGKADAEDQAREERSLREAERKLREEWQMKAVDAERRAAIAEARLAEQR